jgi:hypothetical protein
VKKPQLIAVVAILVLVTVLAVRLPTAFAHEGREVGPYILNFGWRIEPAYVGVFNGPELSIMMEPDGAEGEDNAEEESHTPVEGAEETLQFEVVFGGQSKVLRLEPVRGEPGHYTADLIPTRPGDYSFHLTGKIGETEIDETFSSADGEFSSVEPASDVLFPDPQADIVALQAQIDALKAEIEQLKSDNK